MKLAAATGIPAPNISEFLNGRRKVKEQNLTRMAEALGFEIIIRKKRSVSAGARPAARPRRRS
jgi:hypothetical protein